MGLLNYFSKPAPALPSLPRGTFTVDRDGQILVSTLPQAFPVDQAKAIGNRVLGIFRSAQAAQTPLREIIVRYANLKLTAREQRGGAIIFLVPQTFSKPA